jgi:hypothetical protein
VANSFDRGCYNHLWMRHVPILTEAAAAGMLVLFTVGCVEQGPTAPTPPPPVAGNYTLTLEASDICRLPVSRFAWDVEATSSGSTTDGGTMLVRATLPAGDAAVDLNLAVSALSVASGTLTTRSAAFGQEDLRVTLGGAARATIAVRVVGRGEVMDGTYNGAIALAPPDDPDPSSTGSCTAANHRWTLVVRQAGGPG